MRIVIDLQAGQTETSRNRGTGRYSLCLAEAVAAKRGEHELRITLNGTYHGNIADILNRFTGLPAQAQFSYYHYPVPDKPFDSPQDYRRPVAEALIRKHYAALHADVLHISSVFEGFWNQAVVPGRLSALPGTLCSATLYDLTPLIFRDTYLANPAVKKFYYQRLSTIRSCDLLLAISESTRQDAINYLDIAPDKIVTVSGAADPRFRPVTIAPEQASVFLRRYAIDKRYVLYVGGLEFHKNIKGAISGYARLPWDTRRQHQLVVVWPIQPDEKAVLADYARGEGLADDELVFTGFVPDDDLVRLYNLCTLFLFPPLYEGLGLPVLEAMACGAPVLAADNSSIPEIIGRRDALFDAKCPEAITDALYRGLADPAYREDLKGWSVSRSALFNWEKSAAKTVAAFEEAHEKSRPRNAMLLAKQLPRRKIAYFSPLSNRKSDIADYSAALLPELARYYDIDLFTDTPGAGDDYIASNFAIYPMKDFPGKSEEYAVPVYQLGNSPFHTAMYELLQRHPGIVVLHGFYYGRLLQYIETAEPAKTGLLWEEAEYSHGAGVLPVPGDPQEREDFLLQYPCNRRLLDTATGIIVPSQYCEKLSRQFYPEGTAAPCRHIRFPKNRIPEADAQGRRSIRQELGFRPEDVVIVSLGCVASSQMNDVLIEAFRRSGLTQNAKVRLVFVGEPDQEEYGEKLRDMIRESGLADSITITGFQTREQSLRYLQAADFAVQLRKHCRGETSAAVLDCLAAGVPVILNAPATCNDYSDDIVRKISENAPLTELTAALEQLTEDTALREQYARRSKEYLEREHHPAQIAAQYATAIETFTQQYAANRPAALVNALGNLLAGHTIPEEELNQIANCVVDNTPSFKPPRILVDVSYLIQADHHSGISRVVKNIAEKLYEDRTGRYRPQLVRLDSNQLFPCGIDQQAATIRPLPGYPKIQAQWNDILFMLDSSWFFYDNFSEVFTEVRRQKGKIYTVVYDLIPILHAAITPPDIACGFPRWLHAAIQSSDGLVCISRAVADELIDYIEQQNIPYDQPLNIGYFHLGADFKVAASEAEVRPLVDDWFAADGKTFLIVGWIDARKGQDFALEAFEKLWAAGSDVRLVFAGKHYYNRRRLIARVLSHPEYGKRLLWINTPTDAEMRYCYRHATALLFPSIAEGFGIPLIEAAHHGLPVLCSDIPVFREIAGDYATYFPPASPQGLAEALAAWLDEPQHPDIAQMPRCTWEQSSQQLLQVILHHGWYKTLPPNSAVRTPATDHGETS